MSTTAVQQQTENSKEASAALASDDAAASAPVVPPVQKKTVAAELRALASNAPFMIALAVTIIAGYGYSIVHNSISTDDFTAHIYYPLQGEMVAQGRFTIVILANLPEKIEKIVALAGLDRLARIERNWDHETNQ